MKKIRSAKRVALAAGVFFLCAAPGLTRAQSSPPGPVQTPHNASPVARPKKDTLPTDDLSGLTFTHEQKAKIDQIRQNFTLRRDAVVKDEKLSPEQKAAMLQGFQRMENGQIFTVLDPEQQLEVRKKVLARRAAEKEEREKMKQEKMTQSLPK